VSAWEGYQQQGKDCCSKLWLFTSSNRVHPAPVAQKNHASIRLSNRRHTRMDNMIEVYEPTNSVVMVYVNNDGEISASMSPSLPWRVFLPATDNVTHSSPHPLTTKHIGTNPLNWLALESEYGTRRAPSKASRASYILLASCQCVSPNLCKVLAALPYNAGARC